MAPKVKGKKKNDSSLDTKEQKSFWTHLKNLNRDTVLLTATIISVVLGICVGIALKYGSLIKLGLIKFREIIHHRMNII